MVSWVTTPVNAAPMTMPTARSTTLPRMMKSLKPLSIRTPEVSGFPSGTTYAPEAGSRKAPASIAARPGSPARIASTSRLWST